MLLYCKHRTSTDVMLTSSEMELTLKSEEEIWYVLRTMKHSSGPEYMGWQ